MNTQKSPILIWFRRDLRLRDHAALSAACATGRPVIPVFILDAQAEALGAAPKWRLGQGLEALGAALNTCGSRLILRRGAALVRLRELIAETGASAVYWSRAYDPQAIARDGAVRSALKAAGADARSFPGHMLFEPWSVAPKSGAFFKVYTPFWTAVKDRDVPLPRPAPARIAPPSSWPVSDRLESWALGAAMRRGAAVVAAHTAPGEAAALDRLERFIDCRIEEYGAARDFPARDVTSGLSDHLSLGEIGPHRCWHAGLRARAEGCAGAEHFLKELVWREFAWHLLYHTPRIANENWRPGWDGFPWNEDAADARVVAWRRGRTGIAFVDAAMREMYVTGRMHNRGRMIAASYLTKHLMSHWRIGMAWFADCLTDWDPASNAMGWQWVAGSGPDAAPYFRVFNPDTQSRKFDPDGAYARRWIAEGQRDPPATAQSYFAAIPPGWAMRPDDAYPEPVISAEAGRRAALAAYEKRNF